MDWRVCGWSVFDVPAASFEAALTECWGSTEEVEGHLQAPTLPTIFTHDLESLSRWTGGTNLRTKKDSEAANL